MIGSAKDYRDAARRRLPRFLFDYIDDAANDETTARRNCADLQEVALRQRVLRDVSSIELGTTLFGTHHRLPIAFAPIGITGMYARRGETQVARAAKDAGLPMCLSTMSLCPLAEVAATGCPSLWFQLYVIKDRGFMVDLLARAQAAGCTALVFTVDLPTPGARYRDVHSGMSGSGVARNAKRVLQALARPRWA